MKPHTSPNHPQRSLNAAAVRRPNAMVLLLALALLLPSVVMAHESALPSFSQLVKEVRPAVVSIRVEGVNSSDQRRFTRRNTPEFFNFPYSFDFFFGPDGFDDEMRRRFSQRRGQEAPQEPRERVLSTGSGFFISDDGLLVTNQHVIGKGTKFTISLDNGDEHMAELVGVDTKSDLAVLRVPDVEDMPYVTFAEDSSEPGDWVVAVGSPFNLGGTVTAGIVSAKSRSVANSIYDDFIQIDAPINRGNSGGPVFNLDGTVIGVSTAIISPYGGSAGIGFAIPAETASRIVNQISENGTVTRGWLGVGIQTIDEGLASAIGLSEVQGALINRVYPDTPASASGLQQGDVILSVGEEEVESSRDLARIIGDLKPGTVAVLNLFRSGSYIERDVELGTLDPQVSFASLDNAAPN